MQVIIGKNEIEKREVNVRRFGSQAQESMELDAFLAMVKEEAKVKFKD